MRERVCVRKRLCSSPCIPGGLPSRLALFPLLVWGLCQDDLNFLSSQLLSVHLIHSLSKQNNPLLSHTEFITHANYLVNSEKNSPSQLRPFLRNGQKHNLSIFSLAPAFQTERRSFQEALQSLLWPASLQRAPWPTETKKDIVTLYNRTYLWCFEKEHVRLANLGHDLWVWLSDRVSPLNSDWVPPHLDLATH